MVEKTGRKITTAQEISFQYEYDWNRDGQKDTITVTFNKDQSRLYLLEGNVRVQFAGDKALPDYTQAFGLFRNEPAHGSCGHWSLSDIDFLEQTDSLIYRGSAASEEGERAIFGLEAGFSEQIYVSQQFPLSVDFGPQWDFCVDE